MLQTSPNRLPKTTEGENARKPQDGGFLDLSQADYPPWNIGINYVEHSFPLDEPGSGSDSFDSSAGFLLAA
jgi:hypothetical protein